MKVLCGISGIEFACDHIPFYASSREAVHPIFHLPQKKLFSLTGKWTRQELTKTDSYLLFLAILHSTEHIEWRVPVQRTALLDSVIATVLPALITIVAKMNSVQHPAVTFARFSVTPDTKTLANVEAWISTWISNWKDFEDGYRSISLDQKLLRREQALARLIKNPILRPEKYAGQIAEWAALAGDFPESKTLVNGMYVPLSEYWKSIIRQCVQKDSVFDIPTPDLAELIEHCEEYIPAGNIYAHALFKILRDCADRKKQFYGLETIDVPVSSVFRILSETDTVESANLAAMIDSAPEHKPVRGDYPTTIAYLRAKLKWDAAQQLQVEKSKEML